MALAAEPQTHCDRCRRPLVKDAAYCEACGQRTRRAQRLVRLTLRIELLALALFIALVIGFTFLAFAQK